MGTAWIDSPLEYQMGEEEGPAVVGYHLENALANGALYVDGAVQWRYSILRLPVQNR